MNGMQVFENPVFGQVRTVTRDGEPWFVLKDVCTSFGETNYRRVSARLDEDEKGVSQIDTPGGNQSMTIVNESGLYAALFAMQPEKARGVTEEYVEKRQQQLKSFKRWITHEVIPAIRRHGGYLTPEKVEEVLSDPDTIIQLATQLKESRAKVLHLEAANSELTVQKQIMQPKADYFDELVDRNLLTGFRETAKQLGVKEKDFVKFLTDHRYVYRDKRGKLMPYAEKNTGLFEVKECYNEKTQWSGTQTMITPRGRETFRLLCQGMAG